MIAACKRGKIDLILAKSLSRFARNTVDSLDTVRMLKGRGIGVIFEKENINTLTESSEFLITLFSGFAQAESESLSKNVSWGKEKSMKAGNVSFQYKKLLGYRKGEDGKPEIMPEEAETVRRIYRRYLDGCSLIQIQQELEADHVPTAQGIQKWTRSVLQSILTNERYIGDALLGKTYITDCISKTVRRNNGERPMYYVENNHPAIIPRELFHRVQEEMTRRSSKRKVMLRSGRTELGKYSAKYALTELLVCGECGSPYKRVTWARNGKKRIVWRCVSRLEFGTKYCHSSPTLAEEKLHRAILEALNEFAQAGTEVKTNLLEFTAAAWNGGDQPHQPAAAAEGHQRPADPAAGPGPGTHGRFSPDRPAQSPCGREAGHSREDQRPGVGCCPQRQTGVPHGGAERVDGPAGGQHRVSGRAGPHGS